MKGSEERELIMGHVKYEGISGWVYARYAYYEAYFHPATDCWRTTGQQSEGLQIFIKLTLQ